MTEDQRQIVLIALRAAEDHYYHCRSHCNGDESVDRTHTQVRNAIKALGEPTAEELHEALARHIQSLERSQKSDPAKA